MDYSTDNYEFGNIGLVDVMATLALIFILISLVFVILSHNKDCDIDEIEEDMAVNIAILDSIKSSNDDLKFQSESVNNTNANLLFIIDSLSSNIGTLRDSLDMKRVKKIIIPNELKGKVFFKSGSAKIESQFYPTLNDFTKRIKNELDSGNYNLVQIEGHTDIDKIRFGNRKFDDNWDLGAARAVAVVRYLKNKGISSKYLSATSHSYFKPVSSSKAENRRIEVVLLKK